MPDTRPVAGLSELAMHTGVAYETLRGWAREGRLDHLKVPGQVSGRVAYDRRAAVEWVARHPPRIGRPPKSP